MSDDWKQKQEIERTPEEWKQCFISALQNINSEYYINKEAKGNNTEFLRQLDNGVYVSHNYLRRPNRGAFNAKYSYDHCFGLLLSTKQMKLLYVPYLIGGRFDHNYTISHAFRENGWDTKQIFSSHMGRKGTEELVAKTMNLVESKLLPQYLNVLKKGKKNLLSLYETALEITSQKPNLTIEREQSLLNIKANMIAEGKAKDYSAIVLANIEVFSALAEELPLVIDNIRKL